MKIEFESREEIQRLATMLQNGIYPAPIIIDVEDLVDACGAQEDAPLPWNTDGFHIPLRVDKMVNKAGDKTDGKLVGKTGEKSRRNNQCAGRRETSFRNREAQIFLAGQLAGYFCLTTADQSTMRDVAKITGQVDFYLVDQCRIQSRRMARRG